MHPYRGFGLALLLAGLALSAVTVLAMGLNPLLALWIGASIVGASMYLTPVERLRLSREAAVLMNDSMSIVARVVEGLRLGSSATYVAYGGEVYIFVSREPLEELPERPPRSLVYPSRGGPVVVFRSPVSSSLVGGAGDECSSISYLVVDLLDAARSVRCASSPDTIVVDVVGPYLSSPGSMERTVGSLYAVIVASVAALSRGSSRLESDRPVEWGRRVEVRSPSS